MLTFTGHIDNYDGLTILKRPNRSGLDACEVRLFTITGEHPHAKLEHSVDFVFSPSLLEQAKFIEDAGRAGKKLRITVEAVD